jgi:hypothetical protein
MPSINDQSDLIHSGLILLFVLLALYLYFLPTFVARSRHSNSTGWIFLFNLFAGATGVVWIMALIWAYKSGTRPPPPPKKRD